jgi:prophage regulatory protein
MDDPPGTIRPNAGAVIDDELWSIRAIIARTGLSRSTIYDYIARGLFPRQRRLGPRRVGWLASEVRAWIANRPPR